MTSPARTIAPTSSAPADQYDERRDALARSALTTLGERGYAGTSLREIAANSSFSHGVVHYYFRDKAELIVHSVQLYKKECVTRYDDVVAQSRTAEGLREAFGDRLVDTLLDDVDMHRLWYDLRARSMFEPRLREAVLGIDAGLEQMIWRVVLRYAELSGQSPKLTPSTAYAVLDGLFEQALVRHLGGDTDAADRLRRESTGLLSQLFG